MSTWTNKDGLTIKSGTTEADKRVVGEFRHDGPWHVVEIALRADKLPAVADNSVVISDKTKLPKGALIEAVELSASVDFASSGSGTLNIGVTDADGGTNIQDVGALVAEATAAEINLGTRNASGWVGTLVNGLPIAEAAYLTWEVNTGAFQSGVGVARVYYSIPNKTADTLGT